MLRQNLRDTVLFFLNAGGRRATCTACGEGSYGYPDYQLALGDHMGVKPLPPPPP